MAYRPFDLTGKVALVTGGNGGIGFGMVEALAQAGADVVIWGSNGKKNTAAAEALKDSGVRVLTQVVDVADENAVREGMAEAVRQMGRIDTVVANAASAAAPPPSRNSPPKPTGACWRSTWTASSSPSARPASTWSSGPTGATRRAGPWW